MLINVLSLVFYYLEYPWPKFSSQHTERFWVSLNNEQKKLKISLPCNCLLQVRYATLWSGNNNTVKYMVTANTLLINSRLQQSHFHLPKNILYCKLIRYSNWNQNILKSKLFCFPALDYKNVFLFFISLTEQLYKTWLKRKCAWYGTPVDIHEDKRIQ